MPIELKSVSYIYSPDTSYSVKALDNISLKINEGEFIGITGRTGCGKSTLLQIIDGLLRPDSGTVLFNDADINSKSFNKSILRQKIGVVFQFPEYQLFETTVERDVSFALKHMKLGRDEKKQRVYDALNAVGLDYDTFKNKSPLSCSGGEKRKIAIAGALASNPEYLIFDEPAAGLDPAGRVSFMKLVSELNAKNTAVIIISHNIDIMAEYAKRIIVLDKGRIVKDGAAAEVLSDYSAVLKSGINAGNIIDIAEGLRKNGADVYKNTVKYNQLINEICRIYGGGCV